MGKTLFSQSKFLWMRFQPLERGASEAELTWSPDMVWTCNWSVGWCLETETNFLDSEGWSSESSSILFGTNSDIKFNAQVATCSISCHELCKNSFLNLLRQKPEKWYCLSVSCKCPLAHQCGLGGLVYVGHSSAELTGDLICHLTVGVGIPHWTDFPLILQQPRVCWRNRTE